MADRNDGSPGTIGQERAERFPSTADATGERLGSVVAEFVDAARSAAESLLEEQKQQVGERVSGIAAALRSAADSLERSQNRVIARYAEQAGDQIDSLSRTVRERRWNEILADTEDFARRQPTLFVLGAVAAGFLVGRFLWAASGEHRQRSDAIRETSRSEATRSVTAAVSSGSGTGEAAGYGAGSSGAMEAR